MSRYVLVIVLLVMSLRSAVAKENCDGVCMQDSLEGKGYGKDGKAVVCYFTSHASNREGKASFKAENIDASLCSHVIYSYTILHDKSLENYDLKVDLPNDYFKSLTDLKQKGVKVMIYFGGWNDPNSEVWKGMLDNAPARKDFAASIVKFLEKHNFDGLDIGYSTPGCTEGNMQPAQDAISNFIHLLTELKTAFKGKYLLTAPATAKKEYIEKCYNMAELCKIVDWINLGTYKYHEYVEGVTGAQSPLCGLDWTVTDTIKHYLNEAKCPPEKLVLGFAFYTQTFTMVDDSPAQFGVPVSGPGTAGQFTTQAGWVAYYETCSLIKDGGYNHDYNKVNGSYAWKEKQFLSFEGVVDVARKSCLINEFNLKGANMWTMDYDDFNDMCGCGKYPLLKTLNQHLRGLKTTPIKCY